MLQQVYSQEVKPLSSVDLRRYYIDKVLFEMVKLAQGRELAFLGFSGAVRHIKAHAVHYLKQNFEAFHFFEKKFNIYYSLAHLENMPMFSFAPGLRSKQQAQFRGEFKQCLRGFDIGLDFDQHCISDTRRHSYCTKFKKDITLSDCKVCSNYQSNWSILYDEAKILKSLFDDYHIPYQLKCSGSGLHINIDWQYLQPCMDIVPRLKRLNTSLKGEDMVVLSSWFACELCDINNLTTLDKSVFDIRRPWKMPYSLDIKTGHVALPLTDIQFEKFDWSFVKPENVLINIRDRGLLERKGTSEDLKSFMEDFLLG